MGSLVLCQLVLSMATGHNDGSGVMLASPNLPGRNDGTDVLLEAPSLPSGAVIMWYDGDASSYGDIAAEINSHFAKANGHAFFFENRTYRSDRSAAWQKLDMLNATLRTRQYDFVLLIDSDATFVPWNAAVFGQVLAKNSDKDVIFGNNLPWSSGINTGAIIVRTTELAIAFFEQVIREGADYSDNLTVSTDSYGKEFSSVAELCAAHADARQWEQECVLALYDADYLGIQAASTVEPWLETIVNYHDDSLRCSRNIRGPGWWGASVLTPIAHWASCSTEDRVAGIAQVKSDYRESDELAVAGLSLLRRAS